jgi:hypothetical protein
VTRRLVKAFGAQTTRLEKAALPRPFEAQDELKFGGFHLEKMAR